MLSRFDIERLVIVINPLFYGFGMYPDIELTFINEVFSFSIAPVRGAFLGDIISYYL